MTIRDEVTEPRKPYLQEVAESFWFFLKPSNATTFVVMIVYSVFIFGMLGAFRHTRIPLAHGFGRGRGLAVTFLVMAAGYLCAYYIAVIKEAAAGEDELPNPWPTTNPTWELAIEALYFVGTTVWVLLPTIVYMCIEYAHFGQITWPIAAFVAILGLMLWPAAVLCASISGNINDLWPMILLRTALAEPLAYLVTCMVMLLAVGLCSLPYTDFYQSTAEAITDNLGTIASLLLFIFQVALTTYAMFVSMRVIGLYYRHFKQEFPWTTKPSNKE